MSARKPKRDPNACFSCGRKDLVESVDNHGHKYMGCPSCKFVDAPPKGPIAEGTAADERASVVNWLRERANFIRDFGSDRTASDVLYREANAIEAGRHRGVS